MLPCFLFLLFRRLLRQNHFQFRFPPLTRHNFSLNVFRIFPQFFAGLIPGNSLLSKALLQRIMAAAFTLTFSLLFLIRSCLRLLHNHPGRIQLPVQVLQHVPALQSGILPCLLRSGGSYMVRLCDCSGSWH